MPARQGSSNGRVVVNGVEGRIVIAWAEESGAGGRLKGAAAGPRDKLRVCSPGLMEKDTWMAGFSS